MTTEYFNEPRPEFDHVKKQVKELIAKSKSYFAQEHDLHNELGTTYDLVEKLSTLKVALPVNPEYQNLREQHYFNLRDLERSWGHAEQKLVELGVKNVGINGTLGKLKPASPEEDFNQYYSSVKNLINQGIQKTRVEMGLSKDASFMHDVLMMSISKPPVDIQNVSEELKKDKEVILAAISKNPDVLQYASEELKNEIKNDPKLLMAAIAKNPNVLQYASDELINNREVFKVSVAKELKNYVENKLKQVQLDIENGADPKLVLAQLEKDIVGEKSMSNMPSIKDSGFNVSERITATLENKEKHKVFEITSDILLKRNFDISSKCASGYYNQDLINSAGGRLLHLTALNNPDALETLVYKGGADINMIKPEWVPNEETRKEVERMQFEKNHPIKSSLGMKG